ncbi:acyl-CoA thioesterase/BAAT N-terminal domain-containing protein [Pseudonocardia asaccharolytica]|uniref:Acyl-CoA thioester hydrolase/bile acid-CoA amino acid N-acetyltransferase domain-containing protein n=1 Tax=Pseudonocardia asaccharolytica DSM 44247 = NBRC 16224 TaxID=1123024 RepID=A0A511D2H4_9PSEU|nr:acyl-CoA thioesterase/BAAT N-terminal domain-containing protein [Pseudonocardia asaccharolytica]GEL18887.1 hypothetical protein PA7_27240 [Pseudonocardia asaccharolytica DSM 44247 = NBRC 16224]
MTASALVPPLVDGAATLRDAGDALSVVCYWVLPFALAGLGGLVSGVFPSWFETRTALVDGRTAAAPAIAVPPTPPTDLTAAGIELDVPVRSRHDEPFAVVVRASAGAAVELAASGVDLFGRAWRSVARFTAPPSGLVEPAVLVPDSGDWATAAPDAPLWAMRFAARDAVPELFVPPAPAWPVTVSAAVGAAVARRTVIRVAAEADVRLAPVDVGGRPGVLAVPEGPPPATGRPGVVCFGGSEGGHDSQVGHAALLASHGFAALAVSWVDETQAAEAIAEVPLERFDTALRWLATRDEVSGPVAAMGGPVGRRGCSPPCAPDRSRLPPAWC